MGYWAIVLTRTLIKRTNIYYTGYLGKECPPLFFSKLSVLPNAVQSLRAGLINDSTTPLVIPSPLEITGIFF